MIFSPSRVRETVDIRSNNQGKSYFTVNYNVMTVTENYCM